MIALRYSLFQSSRELLLYPACEYMSTWEMNEINDLMMLY
jgi:hypothetical protein